MRKLLAILLAMGLSATANAAITEQWKMQDNAASTTIVATVGTDGTLLGGDNTSTLSTTGPGGQYPLALDFNGVDDAVDISGSTISFASGAAFSVNLWFTRASVITAYRLTGEASAHNSRIAVTATNTVINVRLQGPGTEANWTVPAMSADTWYHLLVTRDTSNNVRVFFDGTESTTGSQVLAETFSPGRLCVGNSIQFLDGKMAGVKIFNTDESANVDSLFAEGSESGGSVVPILIQHYHAFLKRNQWREPLTEALYAIAP